jgi:cell division cycle 14
MYLKQLEWSKWSAIDELRSQGTNVELALGEEAMDETSDGRHTPTKNMEDAMKLEVSTPRHIAATQVAVGNIANPPQPRKSPTKNFTAVDPDEELDNLAALDDTPTKPVHSRPRTQRSLSASKVGSKEALAAVATVDSSFGPTRQLRSQTAAGTTPVKSTPAKPGRIPKLARAKDAESTTFNTGNRGRATNRPPPPATTVPSRLPTLVPAKRSYVVVEADSGAESSTPNAKAGHSVTTPKAGEKSPAKDGRASPSAGVRRSPRKSGKLKLVDDNPSDNGWINGQQASSVVMANPKSGDRPSLRNVKRRRSSFSSVDVVA